MALTQLWLHALVDALDAPLYAARDVGYQLSITFEPGSPDAGLTFAFSGYSDRMNTFVTRAADEVRRGSSDTAGGGWLSARRYGRIHQEVIEKFRNFMREQPYSDALYFHRLWAQQPHWSVQAVLAELAALAQVRKHGTLTPTAVNF